MPGAAGGVADQLRAVGFDPGRVFMIPVRLRTRQDRRGANALDLGPALVLAKRADIAPSEDEYRLAAQEIVPGLAEAPADLCGRTGLVQVLQKFQRLDVAGAVDQRLHVGRIEPVDIVVLIDRLAGGDGEGGREATGSDSGPAHRPSDAGRCRCQGLDRCRPSSCRRRTRRCRAAAARSWAAPPCRQPVSALNSSCHFGSFRMSRR